MHSRIFSSQQLRANRAIWLAIIFAILVELTAMPLLGITLDAPFIKSAIIIAAISIAFSIFYRYVRRDDGISLFAGALAQLICGSFAISIGTYLTAYMGFPLADPALIVVDSTLGFHWWDYAHWIDSIPWLGPLLMQAYGSCNIQLAILLPLLFFHRPAHGQRVFITLLTAGMITALLSGFFPAVGAYVYYNVPADAFHHFTPTGPTVHQEQLLALLHHTTTSFTYPGDGIVGFPSYHSVIALTLIYAALPYPPIFVLSLLLNSAVLLSTPIAGAHYLSDVLGGIIVTGTCLILAERILPRSIKQPLPEHLLPQ